jgi:hypothetical protein
MSCLGRDASPSDKANDEFACAESVNEVVFKAFNDYAGGDLSTTRMYLALANNKKFAKVTSPLGRHRHLTYRCGNGSMPNGHVGIIGDNGQIMSNNSATGLWDIHFTLASWKARYVDQGDSQWSTTAACSCSHYH